MSRTHKACQDLASIPAPTEATTRARRRRSLSGGGEQGTPLPGLQVPPRPHSRPRARPDTIGCGGRLERTGRIGVTRRKRRIGITSRRQRLPRCVVFLAGASTCLPPLPPYPSTAPPHTLSAIPPSLPYPPGYPSPSFSSPSDEPKDPSP